MELMRDLPALELSSQCRVNRLSEPEAFISTVMEQISLAKDNITLSALYLGTGVHEQRIIHALLKSLEDPSKPNLKVTIILDHSRAQRGQKNSVSMLAPLVEAHPSRVKVLLYQVPQLRGFLQSFITFKFRELLGVYHCKFGVFDNKALLTGANLSHEYFTARQDRYFLIEPAIELASDALSEGSAVIGCATANHSGDNMFVRYLTQFLAVVEKDCHRLLPSRTLQTPPRWGTRELREEVQRGLTQITSQLCSRTGSRDGGLTQVHPIIQHRAIGITQESDALMRLCGAPGGLPGHLHIATPYANFRPSFLATLLRRASAAAGVSQQGAVALTVPTVPAHGFGTAKGWLRFVPALHHYALHEPLRSHYLRHGDGSGKQLQLTYFMRQGHTYHTKGMWWFPAGSTEGPTATTDSRGSSYSADGDDVGGQRRDKPPSAPVVTYLGSSNFSERSWSGDFELGFIISTQEPSLQRMLREEHAELLSHCGVAAGGGKDGYGENPPGVTLPVVPAGLFPHYGRWQRRGLYLAARLLRRLL